MTTKFTIFISLIFCTICTTYSQVSGTVKNESGIPIANALVCLKNQPEIFDKTDESGRYTLSKGTAGSILRVGALGYATVKSTSNKQIVLGKDKLLATDVYHTSFDHLRVGSQYTDDELKKDFYTSYGKGFYDGTVANDRASVDYNESRDAGGVSLKVRFPKGKLKTGESGVDTRIPLTNTFRDNDFQSRDLYISYWIKFSDNFDFSLCGGKLPSLGGTTPGTRDNVWKGRIMWRKGGSIQFYMELPQSKFSPTNEERFWGPLKSPGTTICDYEYTNYLSSPGWHNIELHYRFEEEGKSNGIFEGWVDGKNYDFMNASVFNNYEGSGRPKITINYLLLSAFLGGSSTEYEPKEDIYAWFDEFRVSTTRIDEFDTYNNSLNIPSNVKSAIIHPNPSSGTFYFDKIYSFQLFDLSGSLLKKGKEKEVDLSGYASGLYFLQTETHKIPVKLIKK